MIFGAVVMGAVGLLCLIFGYLLGVKEKITLLHDYHCTRVSEGDRRAFCRRSGLGLGILGLGILVSALLLVLTRSVFSFAAFALGFAAGLVLLVRAGKKYNVPEEGN